MDQAIAYLNRDPVFHVDMLESIRRGGAEILGASPGGVLLLDKPSGTFMLSAQSERDARRMLSGVSRMGQLVLHGEAGAEAAEETFSLHSRFPVCNSAYLSRLPVPESGGPAPARIRPLDEAWLPFLREHYTLVSEEDYLPRRIRAGVMLGAFVGEEPAGFIGEHEEGSVGLLYVLPSFRRRGIARLLTGRVLNRMLECGQVPYAQTKQNNAASLAMQKGLGFTVSTRPVCWLTAEPEPS